jgi:hypothetical protein
MTWVMIAFPIVFPVFSAFVFDLSSRGVLSILLSPVFYVLCLLWILTGVGIRETKKWSWHTLLAAQVLSFYFSASLLVDYSNSSLKLYAFALGVLVQIHVWLLCRGQLRVPFLFPKIRWWEFGIAGMSHIPVTVRSRPAAQASGQILDLSPKGCFIKSPSNFQPFEWVNVVGTYDAHEFNWQGQVIWAARSTVTHPKGIGVRFIDLDRKSKRALKVISTRFMKEAANAIVVVDG